VEALTTGHPVWSPAFEASPGMDLTEHLVDNHLHQPEHRTLVAEFLEIHHEHMTQGRPLRMTEEHLLYVRRNHDWLLLRAADVREGDEVLAMIDAGTARSKVTKIGSVKTRGLFAPLTSSGRLFVEGVAVHSMALSDKLWADTFQKLPESKFRTTLVERSHKAYVFPSRSLFYFGFSFDYLHTPAAGKFFKILAEPILRVLAHLA